MGKILGTFILFIFLLLLGLPVVFGMGILSLTAFAGNSLYFTAVAQKLFSSIDSFSYLSIVLFIFAAEIMTCCDLTEDLVRFCNAFIGHIRGGLAIVNVLASMLFAGVSGSASADTSGLGRVEIDMMTKAGYDRTYSTTVTVASSILGPIIPPSNIFIIYATIASCSVAGMFMAGILPGIILGAIYMAMCFYYAIRYKHPRGRKFTWRERAYTTYHALPVLLLPVIIIGGISLGVFTAVESAAVATVYAIIIAAIRKKLSIQLMYGCLVRAAKMCASIMLIIAVASVMGYAITLMGLPKIISEWFITHISSKYLFLLVVNVILLVLGCLLDQAPALLLTAPVLLPIAIEYGINPIHFGIIVCVNLTVGLVTPPVGMQLFIGANVGNVKLYDLYRKIWSFVLCGMLALIIITFTDVCLIIPKWLGYV